MDMKSFYKSKNNYLLIIFIYILFISSIRTLLRINIQSPLKYLNPLSILIIEFLVISILFLLSLYFIISGLSLSNFRRSVKSLSTIFWISVFTPLIGHLFVRFFGEYIPVQNYIGSFFFAAVLTLYFSGNFKRSKKVKSFSSKSFFLLASFFSLSFFSIFFENLDGFLKQTPILSQYYPTSSFLSILILILLSVLTILFSLLTYVLGRKKLIALFKSIKPFRTLHFVGLTLVGFIVAYSYEVDIVLLDISIILPVICMILTWQFSTMVNDFYDIDTDEIVHPHRPLIRSMVNPKIFKQIGIICALFSLLLSLLFSLELFFLNLGFVIAGAVYSIPPIRLKNRIFGHVCVGYASVTAFLYGVYGTFAFREVELFLAGVDSRVPFLPDIFSFTLLIFVVFSLSPLINAIDDFEGDKKAGVRNIYTVLGFEKGKKIVSGLIIILFLTPLLIFRGTTDILLILPASIISSFIFYKFENYKFVLGLYFLILLYILGRFLGF